MNELERLHGLARMLLKRARVPERGRMFEKALKSEKHFGAVAHHAAWLLHHAEKARGGLRNGATGEALVQATRAGERYGRIVEVQSRAQRKTITPEESDAVAQLVRQRDHRLENLRSGNVERREEGDRRALAEVKAWAADPRRRAALEPLSQGDHVRKYLRIGKPGDRNARRLRSMLKDGRIK